MGLKEEIKQLRGSLKSDVDTDEIREAAADAAEKGASAAEQVSKAARETAAHLRDPRTYAEMRENLEAAVAGAGAKVEEFPAKYPIVTALGALGFGLALGMAVGRKLR